MAAEVCLLLMKSLMAACDSTVSQVDVSSAHIEARTGIDEGVASTTTAKAIAPTETAPLPKFANLCTGENAQRLSLCRVSDDSRQSFAELPVATAPAPRTAVATTVARTVPTAAVVSPTVPVALNIPRPQRLVPAPSAPAPQFSAPVNRTPSIPAIARQRPVVGPQLYRQRQLALWSGRSYTRLAPNTYADQWNGVTRQPTYQEWRSLLTLEARAIAQGQGQNRLEIIVGDSFGLWLPPEMLPRDRLWLNQSISGDTTAGVLQRLSAFANTRAQTIHLMIGANDLKNGVPEAQIVNNLRQTVRVLQRQHPQARIVMYSVLPTRRPEIANERVRSLNAQIAVLTRQNSVEYRDINQWFQDEGGALRPELTTDGLHLTPQGYALWQQAILARAF